MELETRGIQKVNWISPDLWLNYEARRIRRRNLVKWVDRVGLILVCVGVGFLVYHLLSWAWRVWLRG